MQSYFYQYQAANDASNKAANAVDSDVRLGDKYSTIQLPLFPQDNRYRKCYDFQELICLHLEKERQRCQNQEITKQTFEMLRCRLNGHLLAYFGAEDVRAINHRKISAFITYLQNEKVGAVTINQYLGLLKRVFYLGILEGLLEQMPIFPKLKSKSIPRGSFSLMEYKRLLRISKQLSSI
ncbi:phage integrase SAM-like domain-containing protein [Polynucleobacter sp. MWH-Berg-3C6]|uniref:phage integrase SAM-like domain-containing protein n=1 Tax=Polynucleobacter sp. MWH-Berg-3C6 TaxID=1855882 RepID=UPI001C0C1A51|nr:phage integrase SAM-like domain-containing protein [Polynucleobacter sp. MWH-Berg-3C6]MBU3551642.1 phage integrase SAM-like domain-containing protein [Polynucleobacter sp. MWH-Berg-3C6]